MTPALRAILDRFILDTANTRFVALSLPPDGLDRAVPRLVWSVRQLFVHIAASLESQSGTLHGLVGGGEPARPHAHDAAQATNASIDEVVERIDSALNAMVRSASELDEEQLASELLDGKSCEETLLDWSRHFASHGLDFADALPELRFDPMMLNWLLYADFEDDAERAARQRALLEELREKYPDDEEAEEDDE